MPTAEAARSKRGTVLEQIVAARFGYPNEEYPDREVAVNFPSRAMGVQVKSGGWLYPDIVVTEEPGHFISLIGDIALLHEVTSEMASERWAPLAKAAPLALYVPTGQAGRAIRLCRLHGVKLHKLMVFRQRPAAFGIDISEAYSGPDLLKPIAGLLPPALRPMAYRAERMAVVDRYLQPLPASRSGDVPALVAPQPDVSPPLLQLGAGEDEGHDAEGHEDHSAHLPPPSVAPVLFALGLIVTGAGAVFPGELLGVGIALIGLSALRWLTEDMGYYEAGGPAEFRQRPLQIMPEATAPAGVHMPPPSLSPVIFALGLILTGLGAVFPAELLGAGITLVVFGGVGWWWEDVRAFEEPAEHHEEHDAAAAPELAGESTN